ncbi:MAG: HpaII family restriction endonuclease [Bacteroidia bacterium]|nr:HpaII family restriction endonuclease [Bacteroidia bacterium]
MNTNLNFPPPNYIHLKDKVFAEYNLIYHINDSYSIKQLSKVRYKEQLLFQKLSSKIQQMNLMLVDSIFSIHLADIVLETFLNKISTFKEYINLKKDFIVISAKRDKDYFNYKFNSFINYLLYSNIASEQVYKGEMETDKVYYLKSESGEIDYYPIFRQGELQNLLLEKMLLQINLNKSSISQEEATLCFKISVA